MLQAFGLSYSPDPRVGELFDKVDLSLDYGDKVALVGRNGVGKSLLMRILAGQLRPNSGQVVCTHGIQLAYLPQDFDHGFEGSLADLLSREAPNAAPHAIARSLHRLGLAPAHRQQRYSTLSVGERMRGALAALLASEPDVLLLDEPTNHLDVQAKQWLERFLHECPEAVLLVCHDRVVINNVAQRVLELEKGGLSEYAGGFDDMVDAKRQRGERQQREWTRYREEDRRLGVAAEEASQRAAKVSAKPRGRTYDPFSKPFYAAKEARMDKRAKAILQRVERGREDAPDKPFESRKLLLEFPCKPLRSLQALSARQLRKSHGERMLFDGLNVTLERGSRVAVVGSNGAGRVDALPHPGRIRGGRFR